MPDLRTRIASLVLATGLGLPALAGAVPIDPDGPTTGWLAVDYPNSVPDFANDQTGGNGNNLETDIVGNAANRAFYTAFDDAGTASLTDGMLGFRVRLGTDHGGTVGYGRVATVGIDANFDDALDVFVLVDNPGGNLIRILNAAPGSNSPSTTAITATGSSYAETTSNYDWSPVTLAIDPSATTLDVDADGNPDHFLTFAVAFQDVVNRLAAVGITGVDQNTPFRYVLGTGTAATGSQAAPLNRDIAGANGGTTSTLVWDDPVLGAMSNPYAAGAGVPIPEPGTGLSLGLGLLALARARRRR